MHRLLLVGLNHTTAPLEVREKVVFSGQQRQIALEALRARFNEAEAVLVSTCNRVELYVARSVHGHPREDEMIEFLAGFHSLGAGDLDRYLYRMHDKEAVTHLFSVAASLDSMVLGETQILGQVREAYEVARAAGTVGPLLHPLLQRALSVGKKVMTQTPLGEGRVSVASVAVDYARRIFDHFADKTVLSIGAGEMAQGVLGNFAGLKPARLLVCNRDASKALALAEQFGGQAAPWEKLEEHLVAADIVITSTGSLLPIITRGMFDRVTTRRRWRPMFLIDIALPRDIEASVGEIENVYLYNIDDLQQVVGQTATDRAGAVEQARGIVKAEVEDFAAWDRTRKLGPVIDQLYKRSHEIAQAEVQRAIAKFGDGIGEAERGHLEELARRIVNKLLHDPVQGLRNSDAMHGPATQYLHAMEKLFNLSLEQTPVEDVKDLKPGSEQGEAREEPQKE